MGGENSHLLSSVMIVDSLGIVGTAKWFVGNTVIAPMVDKRYGVTDLLVYVKAGVLVELF